MKWSNKLVLLTGAAGFIGSHLLKRLMSLNAEVLAVDDLSVGTKENIKFFGGELYLLDVAGENFFDLMKGYDLDFIFHFGAPSSVILFNKYPESMFRKTTSGFLNIMELALETKCRKIIYPSSGSVYGNASPPQREDSIPKPVNLYGIAKLTCERIADYYSRIKGVRSIGLRIFAGYGPGEDHKGEIASPVTIFLKSILRGESPIIFGNGTQSRDFVYIDDIIEATVRCAEREVPSILNVGSGRAYSFNDVVKLINELLRKDVKPKYLMKPAGYLEKTQADITLMKNYLDINPVELKEGLMKYIDSLPE
jgi:nucleoside-diphosphate-sugar epimerase